MSTFTKCAAPTTTGSCDPTRHVLYNQGMVVGVDDFNQEFSYLSGHDQWMARELIGYGTSSGLRVITELDVKGPRVVVSPGVAVSPCGQMIRVPTAQCAYLNDWLNLATTKQELISHAGSPPTTIRAYLVLCYRDCPTDNVPIPGEPCRSEDDLMAPSRLADDFMLKLSLDAPGQREEDAVRDFVSWLSAITVTDSGPSSSITEFLDAIRTAAHLFTSPPDSGSGPLPDYLYGSPPSTLVINNAQLCEYLDAAFRLWVTELRPRFRPDFPAGAHCCSSTSSGSTPEVEECLLLAEVDIPVIVSGNEDWQVDDPDLIAIDQTRRPVVVQLRMLQEMLLCGRSIRAAGSSPGGSGQVTLAGDANGPIGATLVTRIQGTPVSKTPPTAGQVLAFDGTNWKPAVLPTAPASIIPGDTVRLEQQFDQQSSAGDLNTTAYARADHTHGTPTHPIPPHLSATSAHNAHRIGEIAGDVTGTIGSAIISKLQNKPVQASNPSAGQVLTFSGDVWRPETPTGGSGGDGSNNLTRILGLSWAHKEDSRSDQLLSVRRGKGNQRTIGIAVVAFGLRTGVQRAVEFGSGFLDEYSFQVFLLQGATDTSTYIRLNVNGPSTSSAPFEADLIRVTTKVDAAGKIIEATEVGPEVAFDGAAIVCDRNFLTKQFLGDPERKVFVEVRGDLIPDTESGLALDGNFLRGELPTGDNVEGGTFWSWYTLKRLVLSSADPIGTADASVSDVPKRTAAARRAPAGAKTKKPAKKKPAKKKAAKKTA